MFFVSAFAEPCSRLRLDARRGRVGGQRDVHRFASRTATARARSTCCARSGVAARNRRRGFAETYGQPSLIPTPSEERARYVDALAGEIERTLESADGVISARVHLVLEESDPLAVDAKPRNGARAAVLLKARPGTAPFNEADVQKLVAGSVAGLDARAVSVVVTAAADPNAAAPASMAALGPLRVTPGTRPLLLAALVGGLALLGLLATLLLLTARRIAALERAAGAKASPQPGA